MAAIPLILIVLFLVFVVGIWITVSLLGLLITLLVAAFAGWVAMKLVPGHQSFGWLGAIVAGLVGSWVGGIILGDAGPSAGGIAIIPAIVGAVIVVFLYHLATGANRG